MPVERLRYLAFSHFESDECGALNYFLAVAPHAVAVCSQVAALVSVEDFADRAPRPLADGEVLRTGPPPAALVRRATRSARLGDRVPLRGDDADAPLRRPLHAGRHGRGRADAVRHPRAERGVPQAHGLLLALAKRGPILERMAAVEPRTLAVMHGSALERGRRRAPAAARPGPRGAEQPAALSARRNGCPGESIATPFRHSGHSASGHEGTESDEQRARRNGERPGRNAPIHDRADRDDAPPGRLHRRGRLPRGLARREDVLDDDDRLRPARARSRGAARRRRPCARRTSRAGSAPRAVSWPMITPPSAGEITARGAELAQLLAPSSRPARSARSGHIRSRAHWRYLSEWRPEEAGSGR